MKICTIQSCIVVMLFINDKVLYIKEVENI
jgi:hypothetical protein